MTKSIQELEYKNLNFKSKIGQGICTSAYLAVLAPNSYLCACKKLISENNEKNNDLYKYAHFLKQVGHPGIIPFIGFSKTNDKQMENILIFKYAKHGSLQKVFNLREQQKTPNWFDINCQMKIIYGVGNTLLYLHQNNIIHGRVTPRNILIDENFEPQLSDINFAISFPYQDISIEQMKEFDLFYYFDPVYLTNKKITKETDIYICYLNYSNFIRKYSYIRK